MKKTYLVILNLLFVLVLCSCFPVYKFTNYFSSSVLKECGISDLVKPVDAENIKAESNYVISYETTEDGFYKNVCNIYNYLVEKNFYCLGIRGKTLSTFFGAAPHYAFHRSSSLEDHIYVSEYIGFPEPNHYLFVFSNGINEFNELVNAVELDVKFYDGTVKMRISYQNKTSLFSYECIEERSYYLGQLLPWLNDNVESVTCEVTEGNMQTIYFSNDVDISGRNRGMASYDVKIYNGVVNNDTNSIFLYKMSSCEENSIELVDGLLLIDGTYYASVDALYFEEFYSSSYIYIETKYQFLDQTIYDVYSYTGNNKTLSMTLNGISYINASVDDLGKEKYKINSSYGTIYIYSRDIFELDGMYYKIISDKDFGCLFP